MKKISKKTEEIVWSEKDAASNRQMMVLSKDNITGWKSTYDILPAYGQKVWIAYYTGMATKGCDNRLLTYSNVDDGYTMAIAIRMKGNYIASIIRRLDSTTVIGETAMISDWIRHVAFEAAYDWTDNYKGTGKMTRNWKEKLVSPWVVDNIGLNYAIDNLEDVWIMVGPGDDYKIFHNPMAIQRFSMPSEYLLKKYNEGAPISPTQMLRSVYDPCTFIPDFWMDPKLIAGPREVDKWNAYSVKDIRV